MAEFDYQKRFGDHTKYDHESLLEMKRLVEDYPYFQAGWMLYLKNLKEINAIEYKDVLKQVAILVPDRKQLYRLLNDQNEKGTSNEIKYNEKSADFFELSTSEINISGNSLIDRFLSSGHNKIVRKDLGEETYENEQENEVIKISVSENDEMITETLAMIYFQQKKYDKASEAFRKLSLKYPEKSVYFATRIEEIEKLRNF